MRETVVVGMAGAPTVAVDLSVRSCHEELRDTHDVLTVVGGPTGLVDGAFASRAGGARGGRPSTGLDLISGRRQTTPADVDAIVRRLREARATALVLAGGNGTMALLGAIASRARAEGDDLTVVGIPKTVDNDLYGVDFSPGFASAARYLALTVSGIARDHRSIASVDPIRIVETMGRGTGWLAAAAGATVARLAPDLAPDLCLVPESTVPEEHIVAAVGDALASRGRAFVVCSEGFAFRDDEGGYHLQNHSKPLYGGVARRLARALTDALGIPARGEVLGTQQRSAHALASRIDLEVARQVGRAAARLVLERRSGVMVGTERTGADPYAVQVAAVQLDDVAGRSRPLPAEFRDERGPAAREAYADWLWPVLDLAPPEDPATDRLLAHRVSLRPDPRASGVPTHVAGT
ncbi:6-phosphofructokinase [Nocardioides sp. LMS-CY]|uniref:6-phosphofructokinase n=1 Tax=Nocardioides sp. (strain LMS-CY) TaxID=2840457 RepID=UPI001C002402|nr:6-phosphofructokinase [Nocardioides sp. LMS-CY]QWF21803.1 6-phosphofructokinase [Nocardioides sp. LMS-CY]